MDGESLKQNRREFLATAASVGTASSLANGLCGENSARSFNPVVVSSANGLNATAKAMERILAGADALDGVIAGVNLVEDDPNDMTVGYGGPPQ